MHFILNQASMVPIYEQIMNQVKAAIASGELAAGEALPSVRAMAEQLRVSALTAKKAYDRLEAEGYTVTVPGKGSYVAAISAGQLREERLRSTENTLRAAVQSALESGVTREEVREILELILEEER